MMIVMDKYAQIWPIHAFFIILALLYSKFFNRIFIEIATNFQFIAINTLYLCRISNENTFTFNHTKGDSQLPGHSEHYWTISCALTPLIDTKKQRYFIPLNGNMTTMTKVLDIRLNLILAKVLLNQLTHHLSKSSNPHIKDSFNKYIMRNYINIDDFILSITILETSHPPENLLSHMSNIDRGFSVSGISQTWLPSSILLLDIFTWLWL